MEDIVRIFCTGTAHKKQYQPEDERDSKKGITEVFTNGSVFTGDDRKARTGSEVYFEHGDNRNNKMRLSLTVNQTNQAAEIAAAKLACKVIMPDIT